MQTSPMVAAFTPFDWFLVLLVIVSTLGAFQKGLIRVLFSLAGLIAGILVASWEYEEIALWLHPWITGLAVAEIVAFVGVLLLVILVFSIVAGVLRRTVDAIGLGFVDRLLGALLGFARGLLFGVAAMMAVTAFLPKSAWVRNSQLAPYFLGSAHALSFVVPEHFQDQIAAGARFLLGGDPKLFIPQGSRRDR